MIKLLKIALVIGVVLSLFVGTSAYSQEFQDPKIQISATQGSPDDRITIYANYSGLTCYIRDNSGIDTITEFLGTTNNDEDLTFSVPDWDPGSYSIVCYRTSGSTVIGTSNSITFNVVNAAAGLLQPDDYFGSRWTPPWLEPLSSYARPVGSTSQRVRRTITISRNGVDFRMSIDAANSSIFNAFIAETEVFFEVRSAPENFRIPTDSLGVEPCPLPALMSIGRTGWILPQPPVENRLRDNPSLSARVIGAIQPTEEFEVLEGPVCSDTVNWWYVRKRDGAVGWTAEGQNSVYFAETFAEVDIEISATHRDPGSQSNVLYFYIDPTVAKWESHRYRTQDDYCASIRLRAMSGMLRLAMWRTAPNTSYYRSATAEGGNYTNWLKHNSGSTLADYSALVTGRGNSNNRYAVYGTMELR